MVEPSTSGPRYTLPPRVVQGLGALLLCVTTALPWAWLVRLRPPEPPALPKLGPLRPEMRILPAGKFQMGSPTSEPDRDDDEDLHEVALTVPFALSSTEVTQGQYERVIGENPSEFKGDPELPVERVSFADAARYCNRLSEKEGLERCYQIEGEEVAWKSGLRCTGYRLPTEAEWEYGARADERTMYAGSDKAKEVAWYTENSEGKTHPVGKKQPNSWGLYDASGNVWEWVWDRYQGRLGVSSQKDSVGPDTGSGRVLRGGSWDDGARLVRAAYRGLDGPSNRYAYQGFRLARSYP